MVLPSIFVTYFKTITDSANQSFEVLIIDNDGKKKAVLCDQRTRVRVFF